jgi:hypothetical protein
MTVIKKNHQSVPITACTQKYCPSNRKYPKNETGISMTSHRAQTRTAWPDVCSAADTYQAVRITPKRWKTATTTEALKIGRAELASRALRDPEDQRRFVAQVRSALAEHVERGEPLQPVRLRERAAGRSPRDRVPLSRE